MSIQKPGDYEILFHWSRLEWVFANEAMKNDFYENEYWKGAMAAGFICDRMELKRAYCMFGIFVGLVAVAMIFAPRTPTVFAIGVLGYNAMVGMAYTGYAAIVLEAIGKKSAATNWNLMAALSNIPIAVMSTVDGYMHDAFGTDAMLAGELGYPAIAIVLFGLFVLVTRPRRARA